MAERIKGLTIDLDLNSIKVTRGLTGLKSAVKGVDREMASNMSTFNRSEKTVARYETQLSGLNKKIEYQSRVVQESKAQYEDLAKNQGKNSKAAMDAAAAYNKELASLNNLKGYTANVTKEFKAFQEQQRIARSGWTKLGNSLNSAGKSLVSFGSGMTNVGKKMTTAITVPAIAAAAALAGISLSKGWIRLVGIDTAKAKLEALGHSTKEVEEIMGSALDSVKGTSFGLDEAATTAANAVAAGVEPGKELTKYLTTTGDAAAIANVSMSEMGSIVNKVRTSGKAYTGELQQLSDRGLPVFKWIASEAKVSQDAVSEMASNGEISSELFMKAIESNIGGAAQIMGEKSFTAGMANMWASVGRLGASFLDAGGEGGGFFSKMKPLMGEMTENIDGLASYAQSMGEKFGEAFGKVVDTVKNTVNWFRNLDGEKKKLVVVLAGITLAAGPVIGILGKMATSFGLFLTAMQPVFTFIAAKGGLLKVLQLGFAALTGPIGLTVAAIAALTAGFVIAYKKSDTFREIVHKVKDAIVQAYQKVKEFLTTNPKFLAFIDSIKQGFSTAKTLIIETITTMTQRIKDFLTSNKFLSFVDSLKDGFATAKVLVTQAFGATMDFVKEKISMIKAFWDSDGKQLMQAFKNVFNGIKSAVTPVINGLVSAFKWAFPYMQTIFSTAFKIVLFVAKEIWGNIKGVIDGGLKIIMGLAKTFSGLFTGDFTKMWEGIKQLFSGAIQFVWNFVQLTFFGKILKGGALFIKSFAGFFTSMWTGIRNTFSNVIKWLVDFVKNRFTSMQTTISNITTAIRTAFSNGWNFIWNGIIMPVVRGIVDFVKNRFTSMRTNITNIITGIRTAISNGWNFIWTKIFQPVIRSIIDFVRGRFTSMRDTIVSIFTRLRDMTRNMWQAIKDRIVNPVRDTVSSIRSRFSDMRDRVTGIFSNLKTKIGDYVTNMVDTVKGMPQKMSDGLKKTAGKVGDGLKAVSNKMTEQLGKGVNGVIGGVNWVLDKVGVSSKISQWSVPQYAHGTDGHKGGLALVGDGKGNNAGRELIQTPDGDRFLSPAKDTLVNLPKGTHVWSAIETKEMMNEVPAYALGTLKNWGKSAWEGTKKIGSKIKDSALDVWDYISNPGKLFNKALDLFGVETPKMGGVLKSVGTGAFKKVKESFKKFVTDKINGFFDGEGGPGGGIGWKGFRLSSPFNPARRHPITGKIRPHNGDDWAANMGKPFSAQAAGRVSYSGWAGGYGNLIKIVSGPFERRYGHNQKNLVKSGQIVKAGQRIGLTGSTGDSTGPHVHYEVRKHGIPLNPRGLKTGARVASRGFYELADGGYPEYVIPTDPARRSDAQKLIALAGKEIQGNKRPNQLSSPSVGTSRNDTSYELISLLADKVDKMTLILIEMLGLQQDQLEALLAGHDINLDGKPLAKVLQPHLERLKNRKGRGPNG